MSARKDFRFAEPGQPFPSDSPSSPGDGAPHEVDGELGPLCDCFERVPYFRYIVVAVCIALAVLSAFPLPSHFSSPETYAGTIATLDAKRDTVLGLTAASAGLSAAVSAIPGDAGTPIADKLMDVSADFMIVPAALYLEKFLLTTLGFTAFTVLFPLALACVAFWALTHGRMRASRAAAGVALKLALMGVVLASAVPASVLVTDRIEATYEQSIQGTIDAADAATGEANKEAQKGEQDDGDFLAWLQSIPGAVVDGVSNVASGAQNLVNSFIDALAIMIVTSCVIPLLVLAFLLWVAKLVLGINVEAPMALLRPRSLQGNRGLQTRPCSMR